MTNPECCDYAENNIKLLYAEYYVTDKYYFLTHIPFWSIASKQIYFCPYCGKSLPKIKMKNVLPEKVMVISDGGYYCDTCEERLNVCECSHPEDMWELDKNI